MSYDLEIASKQQPNLLKLDAQLRVLTGVVEVRYSGPQVELYVHGPVSGSEPVPVFIDASEPAEPEEFDDAILANCRSPKWRTTVTAPLASGNAGIDVGRAVAVLVAQASDGAAFDPQVDGVIWPVRKRHKLPRSAPSAERKIDLIEIQWIVALPKGTVVLSAINPEHIEAGAALCRRFASAVTAFLPSCRLTKVDEGVAVKPFSAAMDRRWRDIAGRHNGSVFHFSGEWPCLGGSVTASVGDPGHHKKDSVLDCVVFKLSLEAEAFEGGSLFAELRTGFVAISHELDAVFGAVRRLRNYVWAKKQLWAGSASDSSPIYTRVGWRGIPRQDQAWIWLHRFYAIRSALPAHRATPRGVAIFSDPERPGEGKLNPSSMLANEFLVTPGQMLATGEVGPDQNAQTVPQFEALLDARGL